MIPGTCPFHPAAVLSSDVVVAEDRFWGLAGRFSYGRCPECGSWILDPRPTGSKLGSFYRHYYSPAELDAQRRTYARKGPERGGGVERLRAIDFVRRLSSLDVDLGSNHRLLDAGCGLGSFARQVRDLTGTEVRGVDMLPACRDFAEEVHGVEVDVGTLAGQSYPDGHFDVVTSWHCLEHVEDPVSELEELARITAVGGHVLVETPTLTPLAYIFRGRWLFLQAPTHLYHFTPAALSGLLERAGFEVKNQIRPWLPSELAGSMLLSLGWKGFAPRLLFPPRSLLDRLGLLLFILFMVIDIPVTLFLALIGQAGTVRIIARRRSS